MSNEQIDCVIGIVGFTIMMYLIREVTMMKIFESIVVILTLILLGYGLYTVWKINKMIDKCNEITDKIWEDYHGES